MIPDKRRCGICGRPLATDGGNSYERNICSVCYADGGALAVDKAMETDYDKRIKEGFAILLRDN